LDGKAARRLHRPQYSTDAPRRKIGAARERSGDGDDQDTGFPSTADDYDDDEMDM
jgi:hypothetical protein